MHFFFCKNIDQAMLITYMNIVPAAVILACDLNFIQDATGFR